MCKDILEKKSVEHVGAYELMKHDKMKRQCFTGDRAKSATVASNTDPKNARQFYSIINPTSWPAITAFQSQGPSQQQ